MDLLLLNLGKTSISKVIVRVDSTGAIVATLVVQADEIGRVRRANPKDIENLVNDVAYVTTKEMVKQGLLARQ